MARVLLTAGGEDAPWNQAKETVGGREAGHLQQLGLEQLLLLELLLLLLLPAAQGRRARAGEAPSECGERGGGGQGTVEGGRVGAEGDSILSEREHTRGARKGVRG